MVNFRFIAADGVEHIITYVADERGYRVTGDAIVGTPAPVATTPRPTQPPTRPPTQPPTQPPTRPPTRPSTRPPTQAPVAQAVVQVVPVQAVQAVPVQYVQLQSASFGGFYHAGFVGGCGDGKEVFGADGARYVLRKI